MEDLPNQATINAHIKQAVTMMKAGARMTLGDIPGDPTLSYAAFPGPVVAYMGALLGVVAEAMAEPSEPEDHTAEGVALLVAQAIAYEGRASNDASEDAGDFWKHTSEIQQQIAMKQARAVLALGDISAGG